MSANFVESSSTDQGLLDQLKSGEKQQRDNAWAYIYQSYFPMIDDHVIQNNGSDEDTADIFHDALMILHYNIDHGRFRGESSLKTYFFSICKNLWLKELKKRQKLIVSFAEMTSDFPDETGYLINVEIVTLLLDELKPDCRDILTEYYFNKRTMAELKAIFNVNSIQAAKNKKYRCLNYLTALFKERGISLEQE